MPTPANVRGGREHQSETAVFRIDGAVVFVTSKAGTATEDVCGWLDVIEGLGVEDPFVVWDARGTGSIAPDDRQVMVNAIEGVIAGLAVVAGSPVPPRVVDLYVTLERMDLPTALFESEAEALDWIGIVSAPPAT